MSSKIQRKVKLENWLENLEEGLASNELTIKDADGKEVTYKTNASVKLAISYVKRELRKVDEKKRRSRTLSVRVNRGLYD